MPLQEFFNSATGDNQRLTRLIAWQTANGIPVDDIDEYLPFYSDGGGLAPTPEWIERAKISSSPERGSPIASKIGYGNTLIDFGDLDPGNKAQWMALAEYFGRYTTSNPSGAHYRHMLSVDGEDAIGKKMSFIDDADEGIPCRFTDLICGGWNLRAAGRENLRLTSDLKPGKIDYWGQVVPDEDNTGVVNPILRHYSSDNWDADSAAKDVTIEIVSDTATTVTFTVKIGAGSASGNQTATKGEWSYIFTGATPSVPYGGRPQQGQIYFPVGIDGSFVTADLFVFPKRRVIDLDDLTYGTERVVAETMARFYVDGTEFQVDNGISIAATIDEAVTRWAGPGGEQAVGTFKAGFRSVELQVDRLKVDLTLQKKLMTRTSGTCVLECKTDSLIGATAAYYGADFIFPNIVFTGTRHIVEPGGQNRNEVLSLRARRATSPLSWRGENYSAACSILLDTDFAEIHDN